MAKVIVKFKGSIVQERVLDKPCIRIGRREGNDIRIDNLAVSGNHAKIEKVNGSYMIVDLKSTNGTFVNNRKIVQAKLQHLDEITIGKHNLVFEDESQSQRPQQEVPEASAGEMPQQQDVGKPSREALGGPAVLRVLNQRNPEEILLQKKLAIIGRREDADVKLKGVFEPKVAALITRKPSGYAILPEAKARVRINGQVISQRTDLKDGDVIEIGSLKLLFSQK